MAKKPPVVNTTPAKSNTTPAAKNGAASDTVALRPALHAGTPARPE